MEKGDGGVLPRSRLEKRRSIDVFLDSCGNSTAIILLDAPLCDDTLAAKLSLLNPFKSCPAKATLQSEREKNEGVGRPGLNDNEESV